MLSFEKRETEKKKEKKKKEEMRLASIGCSGDRLI
jgi:hypothetical protein